jgi:hypothetical protein
MSKVTKEQARYMLWLQGNLRWKLHDVQKVMYDQIKSSDKDIVTILSSRRLGKSFLLCILASEVCIQKPDAIIKYICPEKKMVKTIIEPILKMIFKDCPDELRPELKVADGRFLFPNGSQIHFAGTDGGHAESVRGGHADRCFVDEAGFCNDLLYVVNSILAPTTDTTNGQIILASTPSKETNHEFITQFVKPAEVNNVLMKYTIYDNPMMTPEKIQKIIERYPDGEKNDAFQREYLCSIILDQEKAVIPEFTDDLQKRIVKPWDRPARYDCYASMDIGFKDFTVVVFAYYDFLKAKLVICDELVLNGPKLLTPNLAAEIKAKEKANFSDRVTLEVFTPVRVADNNNLILLQDLSRLHGITFLPTLKDNKEAVINLLRDYLLQEKIIITPNCTTLIAHLKHATWNKSRTSFERAPGFGHYDSIDGILYLLRNVRFNKNPYPSHYGLPSDSYHLPIIKQNNSQFDAIKNIFKSRK